MTAMDFCMKKISAARCDTLYEGGAEQSVDCEINLPDYCSDIRRILKCSAELCIRSVQHTGERITAQGDIILRLMYVNDEEKIDCHEHIIPLSRYVEISNLGNSFFVYTKGSVEYLNCRATSQRRASVNGKVNIKFTVKRMDECEIVASAQGGGVQTLSRLLPVCKLTAMSDKTFDMNETISLSDDEPSVGGILFCGAQAAPSSIKAISGKLLIKGDLTAELVYISDDSLNNVVKKQHTMPISQIVELSGIEDKSDCPVTLGVESVQIQPKTDSSGANRLLEISCRVKADVRAYDEEQTDYIADSYCVEHELQSEYSSVEFVTSHTRREEDKTVRSVIEAGEQGISKPLEMWCRGITACAAGADGKLDGRACADICLVYLDAQEKPVYIEKPVDIAFGGELPGTGEKVSCLPTVVLREAVFSKVGADKIEIRLTAGICTDIYETALRRVCTDMKVDESQEKPQARSALTVYFCDGGERLWDIAKSYGTSVSAITEENGLEQEGELQKQMLLIPMC